MKKNIVVYTAISNGYDRLKSPSHVDSSYDYICFSDDVISKSTIWEFRNFEREFDDPVRTAKHPKILPHFYFPTYDYSVWIDGNVDIIFDINELITKMDEQNAILGVFEHHKRKCIYDEILFCIERKKDCAAVMIAQGNKYQKEGFPLNYGMLFGCILIRKHNTPECKLFMESWWEQIENGSRRDQLSFSYIMWKLTPRIFWIPGTVEQNKWFERLKHPYQKKFLKKVKHKILLYFKR